MVLGYLGNFKLFFVPIYHHLLEDLKAFLLRKKNIQSLQELQKARSSEQNIDKSI